MIAGDAAKMGTSTTHVTNNVRPSNREEAPMDTKYRNKYEVTTPEQMPRMVVSTMNTAKSPWENRVATVVHHDRTRGGSRATGSCAALRMAKHMPAKCNTCTHRHMHTHTPQHVYTPMRTQWQQIHAHSQHRVKVH